MLEVQELNIKKVKPEDKPAIIVNNVTKEFIIPHERRTTLFENIKGFFSPSTYEKFIALNDVSFTVEKGDSIGIIGDNGSGKSTLLKIISGILRPTKGSVEVNGKITPFLELGVGFQPDLTAKENIEVYSTIMGLSKKEINRNMDYVLEFAGLTKFKDTKLKNFSSGMQVRLAFATAIQVKPEILLVDEVLAVGDMEFQQKCLDIFREYRNEGITMLFVSHDLNAVRRFCDKTILLRNSEVVAFGKTADVIDRYVYRVDSKQDDIFISTIENNEHQEVILNKPSNESKTTGSEESIEDSIDFVEKYRSMANFRWGNKKIEILDIKFLDKNGNEGDSFFSGDPMTIIGRFTSKELVSEPIFGFEIFDERGNQCFGSNTKFKNIKIDSINGDGEIRILIKELPLLQGKYFVSVSCQSKDYKITYDWHSKKYFFNVINNSDDIGFIRINFDYEIEQGGH
ncbi:ABC transporter ATP-binding protein [Methanocella sp. CWC-04]|uniref:ABC transporter ATP-binding protein n=1 Tax=Methanooceanicella nereidis TaxID=2052831 RepID=A0AAP2RH55_9EURY|nr:ABC transporter ATP-binding protein [Methanocella sp. CWC-04]MCD1296110.1 ABC transporter ATP-binding protein [Methanocella sp. CWC-04]